MAFPFGPPMIEGPPCPSCETNDMVADVGEGVFYCYGCRDAFAQATPGVDLDTQLIRLSDILDNPTETGVEASKPIQRKPNGGVVTVHGPIVVRMVKESHVSDNDGVDSALGSDGPRGFDHASDG